MRKFIGDRSPHRGNKAMLFLFLLVFFVVGFGGAMLLSESYVSLFWPFVVGMGGAFALYLLITKQKISDVLLLKPLTAKNFLLVVVLTVAVFPTYLLISCLSSRVFNTGGVDAIVEMIESNPMWLMIITVGILPAVFEEIIFRGALFHEYNGHNRGVSVRTTAIITGLLFGLIHMFFEQMMYAFFLGIVMTYILYYTRSIFATIIFHFIINGGQVILVNTNIYMTFYWNLMKADSTVNLLIVIASSIVLTPVWILCFKKLKVHHALAESNEEIESEQQAIKERVFTWPLWISIAVCVLFAVNNIVAALSA